VAIDRVYGSVAVGPFNYETVVGGEFPTRIDFKNVTLAQFGLLGLALRDLAEGRIALGFGKSRGLGRVTASFDSLEIHYPTCILEDGALRLIGTASHTLWTNGMPEQSPTVERQRPGTVAAHADHVVALRRESLDQCAPGDAGYDG
jgi:CRISPR/Cas system CSM-associated protein Csm3 (group 7 of RAMP superfamily)